MDKRLEGRAVHAHATPMVEPDVVRQMQVLAGYGWGAKRIARELKVARNTVRAYLRGAQATKGEREVRGRKLAAAARAEAVRLLDGEAEGNAVVVQTLLAARGTRVSARTVQRAVREHRQAKHAAEVATVRFETAPGVQMQIDFGEKRVRVGGEDVRVFLFVAVLSYSRRLFVKALLNLRHDDWREGLASAFAHFGGVPQSLLCDNATPLVKARDKAANTVTFQPAFAAFCRDWEVTPRACRPYRARTKGKTESGVKYVKRNALAGRTFDTFAALEAHLARWTDEADQRVHGTTKQRPCDRFEGAERAALRPLPARPLVVRERQLRRKVANDALVNVDTTRYSVPHALVGEVVDVAVGDVEVRILRAGVLVAAHARAREPHAIVREAAHYAGLWRPVTTLAPAAPASGPSALDVMGRSLDVYAAAVGGDAP
jgi:transposase